MFSDDSFCETSFCENSEGVSTGEIFNFILEIQTTLSFSLDATIN